MKQKFKGLIFDADGTILDSMKIWAELGKIYLASIGIESKPGLDKRLFSMSLCEGCAYLKEEYNITFSVEKIRNDITKIIEDFYKKRVLPKNGAVEFIKEMKRKNIPMAVATSGDKALIHSAFSRLGIADCFKEILSCAELNTSKKEPDIYIKAAELLGTAAKETVVFEDVLYAVETAKTAGFITVAVEDDESADDRCMLQKTADCYIKDFSKLI